MNARLFVIAQPKYDSVRDQPHRCTAVREYASTSRSSRKQHFTLQPCAHSVLFNMLDEISNSVWIGLDGDVQFASRFFSYSVCVRTLLLQCESWSHYRTYTVSARLANHMFIYVTGKSIHMSLPDYSN